MQIIPVFRKVFRREGEPTEAEMELFMGAEDLLERLRSGIPETTARKDAMAIIEVHLSALEPIARKAAAGDTLSPAERENIAVARVEAEAGPKLLQLADLCRWLAGCARKHLERQPLDEDDVQRLRDYGPTLGSLHFYEGNAWLKPRDDFAMAAPIFSSPTLERMLYAALARPEALYVIVPAASVPRDEGSFAEGRTNKETKPEKPYVLLRGVTLSYREFTKPHAVHLTDSAWQEEVKAGKAPRPPAFTAAFRAPAK